METKKRKLEIGTIRQWKALKVVKHSDGWVILGGKNHGKILVKGLIVHSHPNQQSHLEFADKNKVENIQQ